MSNVLISTISYILPIFAIIVLFRCMRSMLTGKSQTEIWGYLHSDDKVILVNHWENIIGRSRSSDIRIADEHVSRVHAVLLRSPKGVWRVFDIFSKGGVYVDGARVKGEGAVVNDNSTIMVANVSLRFRDISEKQRNAIEYRRLVSWQRVHPAVTLLFLTVFQALLLAEHCFSLKSE